MVNWTTVCLCLAAPAAFALSAHAYGSHLRCPLRSPSSVQCHEQWPDDPHPEALAELPQGEEHPARAELPGAELLSRTLLNPKVDVALGIPVVVSASIFAVQTLALGGDVGGFYFSPLEVFNFLENVESSICIVFLIEYLLRWYASSLAPSYLVKPSAIIDLISFLPLLIQLMMDSQGSAVPDLAFVRLLRVLRLQRYLQAQLVVFPLLDAQPERAGQRNVVMEDGFQVAAIAAHAGEVPKRYEDTDRRQA